LIRLFAHSTNQLINNNSTQSFKEVKMKKTIVIAIVVALCLFVGVAVALSYGPGFGPFGPGAIGRPAFGQGVGPPGFAGGFGPWGSTSSLTAEQSAKLKALREETLKEIGPLQQQLFQKIADLRGLMTSRNPDEEKISALQKEVLAMRGELQEKAEKVRLEVQKVVPELQSRLGGFGPGPGFAPGRARMIRPW
jgi:Spy/CpxP family protein refolding chaperone